MSRYLLVVLCLLVLSACTADPALDLDQLEANARGGDQSAIASLVGLLSAKDPGIADRVYATLVEVGERVTTGQTLCIIEAMKVMNEIEAEFSGTIKEVFVENGNPVEAEAVLFLVDPD